MSGMALVFHRSLVFGQVSGKELAAGFGGATFLRTRPVASAIPLTRDATRKSSRGDLLAKRPLSLNFTLPPGKMCSF